MFLWITFPDADAIDAELVDVCLKLMEACIQNSGSVIVEWSVDCVKQRTSHH